MIKFLPLSWAHYKHNYLSLALCLSISHYFFKKKRKEEFKEEYWLLL